MKYIDELDLKGKRVFIRSDLNVPFDNKGSISNDNRIRASLPTIEHARDAGARVIVTSHLGEPKQKDERFSLKPVAARLGELLGSKVIMAPDCIGPEVEKLVQALAPGEVLVLENPRFHGGEKKNDPDFAKQLAQLADVYVNDAFASCHRAHASVAGIADYVQEKAGGFILKSELGYFNKAFADPERPFIAVFGGAKVSTKMKAIKNVGTRADKIIVGGAMANTFFAAMGYGVGKSLYEQQEIPTAQEAEEWLRSNNCELFLPLDVVVAPELKSGVPTKVVPVNAIPEDMLALDIGPQTIKLFADALQDAKTIIWNGPMGAFETEEFSAGTYGVVDALAASPALTVVGGGDTDLALERRHAMEKMDYVSTAGGAFLTLLEGSPLPGVLALEK